MAEVLAFRRSKSPSGNILEAALSGEIQVPRPDALEPFHRASEAERARRVRRVLVKAWALWRFRDRTLVEAVRAAAENGAEGEYGLMEMRKVLLEINLVAWAAHPSRTRHDIHQLFRRAIARVTPHRGGWRTSTNPEAREA